LAGEGFGEAERAAFGDDEVGVVHEPVDGGGGEAFGHDRVEAGWVQVRGDGDGAAFVGGVDDPVEGFGGVLAGGKLADVIDHDQLAAADASDDAVDRRVDFGPADGEGERLEGEPADPHAGVDDGVGQGFDEVTFAGARRDSDRLQHLRRVLPCEVRVTAAVHPLFGRLLPATGFKRWEGELLLVVVLPDGSPGTIRVDVTDVLGAAEVEVSASVLSVDGLRRLRQFVDALGSTRPSRGGARTGK
jgi:hypothetical protein